MAGKTKGRRRANSNKSPDQKDSFSNVKTVLDSESKENIPEVLTSETLPGPSKKGRRNRRVNSNDEMLNTETLPSISNIKDRRGTFVVNNDKDNVLAEVSNEGSQIDTKPKRKDRGKKRNNVSIEEVQETLTISSEKQPEDPLKNAVSQARKGRSKSQEEIMPLDVKDRRGTFVVNNDKDNVLVEVPNEGSQIETKPKRKERGKKRNNASIEKVQETLTISSEDPLKNVDSQARKGRSKSQEELMPLGNDVKDIRGTFVVDNDKNNILLEVPNEGSQIETKPKKRERGKKRNNASIEEVQETLTISSEDPLKNVVGQARKGRSKGQEELMPLDVKDRRETFVVNNVEDNVLVEVPNEGSQIETKPKRKVRGKKRNNASIEEVQETLTISSEKLPEDPIKNVVSQARKGRNKSQDELMPLDGAENLSERGRDIVFNKAEDNVPEDVPVVGDQKETKRTKKGKGKKRNSPNLDEVTEVLTISSDEQPEEPPKKAAAGKSRRPARQKNNSVEEEVSVPQVTSDIPASDSLKKSKRKGRSKTEKTSLQQTNDDESENQSDRRCTFVVSSTEDLPGKVNARRGSVVSSASIDKSTESTDIIVSGEEKSSETPKKSPRTQQNKWSETSSSLADADIGSYLPVGQVPAGNRRGTFSISKPKGSNENATNNTSVLNSSMLKSSDKKRKRSGSMPDLSKDRKTPLRLSTPKVSSEKKVKSIVGPVTAFNKVVHFTTPDSSNKRKLSKSNITLTPHPTRRVNSTPLAKSKYVSTPNLSRKISTPLSVKKTPGQFSAKKMPNFKKIHQKQFEKMESLVKYTERKASKKDLFSSLNKTFTGLSSSKEGQQNSICGTSTSPTGIRQASKSMIPVRSVVRFSDKEAVKSLANKTRPVPVNSIRERERNIIKGVRANKRFMLQMKMRKITPQ